MTVKIRGDMVVENVVLPFDRVYHNVESFDIVGTLTIIKTSYGTFELYIDIGKLEVTP